MPGPWTRIRSNALTSVVSLGNLRRVRLPFGVSEVVVFADRDEGGQPRALLERSARGLVAPGRTVKVWEVKPAIAAGKGADVADAVKALQSTG